MEIDIVEFIRPEFFILIAVCWVLGWLLKISKIKNELIPIILFTFAILAAFVYLIATTALGSLQEWMLAIFMAITQGFLCAGAAVGGNQLIKQTSRAELSHGVTKTKTEDKDNFLE